MRLFRFCLVIFSLICLSGCASIAENAKYKYVPPDTAQGKQCVMQCLAGKKSCEQLCAMKHGCEVKSNGNACKHACHCTSAFNICYTACGGQVY